tara:strand:- start:70 stop:216 length:147 start_codon:yes stop_codon:yes gene_type:complete
LRFLNKLRPNQIAIGGQKITESNEMDNFGKSENEKKFVGYILDSVTLV